jgi:hypothetical protein
LVTRMVTKPSTPAIQTLWTITKHKSRVSHKMIYPTMTHAFPDQSSLVTDF